MKINVKGTNLDLTDSIYEYIDKKINSLDRLVRNMGKDMQDGKPTVECWVEVGKITDRHNKGDIFRAEAQIKIPGKSGVRAEATEADLHQAIDMVKDDLQRQLRRNKDKMIARRRR